MLVESAMLTCRTTWRHLFADPDSSLVRVVHGLVPRLLQTGEVPTEAGFRDLTGGLLAKSRLGFGAHVGFTSYYTSPCASK